MEADECLKEESWHVPGVGSPTLPVHSKVLKPKDVQETNGAARVLHFLGGWFVDCCIDLVHNPHEEPPIDALKGIQQPWSSQTLPEWQLPFLDPLDPCWSPTHAVNTPELSFHTSVPAPTHVLLTQQLLFAPSELLLTLRLEGSRLRVQQPHLYVSPCSEHLEGSESSIGVVHTRDFFDWPVYGYSNM